VLTGAQIGNYRSIAELNLTFKQRNVIVGPNGSGKSNLIDCFNFIRDCAFEDLDSATTKRHGAESVRRWSKFRPFNLHVDLQFRSDRGFGHYKVVLSSSRGAFRVAEESASWSTRLTRTSRPTNEFRTASFARGENGKVSFEGAVPDDDYLEDKLTLANTDLFISLISGPAFFPIASPFRGLVNEIGSISTYAIYPNTMRQPQVVSKEDKLADDGSNLASILKRLNTNQRRLKTRLIEALRVVMPMVDDIVVRSAGGYFVPVMMVREANNERHEFNMSQLSDGTLRMLGMLTAFYQVNAPRRIAIEEPEQMIHPGLLPVLKDAADDYASMGIDRQYFMTTHSPNLLDRFDPEDIIWMSFDKGVSNATRIDSKKVQLIHDDLFSAGELLVSEGLGL
jgi:predicted ATPase